MMINRIEISLSYSVSFSKYPGWSYQMLSDEQLALEVQKGKIVLLDELVERHHSSFIGFLYRMTGGKRSLE